MTKNVKDHDVMFREGWKDMWRKEAKRRRIIPKVPVFNCDYHLTEPDCYANCDRIECTYIKHKAGQKKAKIRNCITPYNKQLNNYLNNLDWDYNTLECNNMEVI